MTHVYHDMMWAKMSNYDDVLGSITTLQYLTSFYQTSCQSGDGGRGKLLRWQQLPVRRLWMLESSRSQGGTLLSPATHQFQEIGEGVRKKKNSYLETS